MNDDTLDILGYGLYARDGVNGTLIQLDVDAFGVSTDTPISAEDRQDWQDTMPPVPPNMPNVEAGMFALVKVNADGTLYRKPECGDYPAPCNCNNPVTHNGH